MKYLNVFVEYELIDLNRWKNEAYFWHYMWTPHEKVIPIEMSCIVNNIFVDMRNRATVLIF